MNFEKLVVWQMSFELAQMINYYTRNFRDFGLKDQMRRSSVSVASNIAEGEERETLRESIRFLYIAKGSNGELLTQIMLARSFGYIDEEVFLQLEDKTRRVSRLLASLIKHRCGKVL
ncbi:four helix bundle protein [Vibrio sp. JC009]|nr:four helix bundle protein [Vibrio sp. JC009]WED23256.1 four helix bundle protein [Vibrio sp. JC009]